MSRIQKYKESLVRFIKDKSCISTTPMELNTMIYDKIKGTDLVFPILLLTIVNNQNKKNHISVQGYYLATIVEFVSLYSKTIEDHNIPNKIEMSNYLLYCINKSFEQNTESLKNSLANHNIIDNVVNLMGILNESIKNIFTLEKFKFKLEPTNQECSSDIIDWYLKKKCDENIDKFKSFKRVTKESMVEYIEKKYINVSELSLYMGWVVGLGDVKDIIKLKKAARAFGIMYKIVSDFKNLDFDIKNSNELTSNYVLNYGFQDGYEVFLNNKQQFIEEAMICNIYTSTIKEIIGSIEDVIDQIIDQTSPDLKSNYSNY